MTRPTHAAAGIVERGDWANVLPRSVNAEEPAVIELTQEQRRELTAADAPRVVDPDTRQTYVLVREEVYERLKGLLDAPFHPADAYPAIDRAFAAGWNDPPMDDYDRYEELKR